MMKITIEGIFTYAYVLVYMFLFQQGDMFPINLHRHDDQGINKAMTQWISLVRRNSIEFKFQELIDSFVHTVAGLHNSQNEADLILK